MMPLSKGTGPVALRVEVLHGELLEVELEDASHLREFLGCFFQYRHHFLPLRVWQKWEVSVAYPDGWRFVTGIDDPDYPLYTGNIMAVRARRRHRSCRYAA
jgi:hypothetical protein